MLKRIMDNIGLIGILNCLNLVYIVITIVFYVWSGMWVILKLWYFVLFSVINEVEN